MPPFEYTGDVYIRPLGRGICLDSETDDRYLDQAIEAWLTDLGQHAHPGAGWSGALRIRVELVEVP